MQLGRRGKLKPYLMWVRIPPTLPILWAGLVTMRPLCWGSSPPRSTIFEDDMRKHVQCYCHGAIAADPSYLSPWEDVWLRWKGKPGRKVYHASPCLLCSAEIVKDLALHEQIRTDRNEPDWYRKEDATDQAMLAALETQEFVANGEGACLHLVTKAKGFDRKHAERMLAWWLEQEHGITNPKFIWDRPEFVIQPYGFGDYS